MQMDELYPDDPKVLYQRSRIYGKMAYEAILRMNIVAPNSPWKFLPPPKSMRVRARQPPRLTNTTRSWHSIRTVPAFTIELGGLCLHKGAAPELNKIRRKRSKSFSQSSILTRPMLMRPMKQGNLSERR